MPALRALLLTGLFGLCGCAVSVPEPVQAPVAVAPGPLAAARAPAAGPLPALPASIPPASSSSLPALPALQPLQALEQAGDLYGLSVRLQAQARGGDVQAAWLLSRVHEYCAGYAGDPQAYARVSATTPLPVQRARARVQQRCGGFAPADRLGRAPVLQQRRQAAGQGSLAAEASLLGLGAPLYDDGDYRRDLVERVLEARDAEAFYALAPAMGLRAAADPALEGLVAGDALAELAWRVAACRLGKACGPESMVMDNYCANGGICAQTAGDDFVHFVQETLANGQQAAHMNLMIEQLLQARRRTWR